MSPLEINEEKQEVLAEYRALKVLFGGLLLESHGAAGTEDVAYYQRKFREAQQALRR
jgi:hypothetical protein